LANVADQVQHFLPSELQVTSLPGDFSAIFFTGRQPRRGGRAQPQGGDESGDEDLPAPFHAPEVEPLPAEPIEDIPFDEESDCERDDTNHNPWDVCDDDCSLPASDEATSKARGQGWCEGATCGVCYSSFGKHMYRSAENREHLSFQHMR
jgi:hypothetical protein